MKLIRQVLLLTISIWLLTLPSQGKDDYRYRNITMNDGLTIQRLNRLHDRFEPVSISYEGNSGGLRMLQTRDGRIWIGTWENGLLLMHGDGRLEQVLNPTLTRAGYHIHTLYERDDNCLTIGCDDGMICLNPKTPGAAAVSSR